jgi:DNA-binding transcriptional LysR family regulator
MREDAARRDGAGAAERACALDLRALRSALAIQESGGFRAAALRLGLEQSRLSRQVNGLEERLGVSLFQRGRGGAQPTTAGYAFLERARAALEQLRAAMEDAERAGRGACGVVRVGLACGFAGVELRGLMARYRQDNPGVRVVYVEAPAAELLVRLGAGDLDAAFAPSARRLSNLDAAALWTTPLWLATPAGTCLPPHAPLLCRSAVHGDLVAVLGGSVLTGRLGEAAVSAATLMAFVRDGDCAAVVTDADAAGAPAGVLLGPLPFSTRGLPVALHWPPGRDNPALRRLAALAKLAGEGRLAGPGPPHLGQVTTLPGVSRASQS